MQQQLRSGVVVAVVVFFLCHFWLHLKKEEDEENGDEKEMKKKAFLESSKNAFDSMQQRVFCFLPSSSFLLGCLFRWSKLLSLFFVITQG